VIIWVTLVVCAGLLYAFIRWSEWWLRRRILRYLRYQYPDWITTKLIAESMECTHAAALTALDRPRRQGVVISASDKHRAHGDGFTTQERYL
jgi:hypothetical protein